MIIGIDPGYEQSAYIRCRLGQPLDFGILPNRVLMHKIKTEEFKQDIVVLEIMVSYGMPVGQEVLDTCRYIGQMEEALLNRCQSVSLIDRREIKLALCHDSKGNDASIKQALIDLYGPTKDKAIGKKKTPGPLFGIKYDIWQALAVVVAYERRKDNESSYDENDE